MSRETTPRTLQRSSHNPSFFSIKKHFDLANDVIDFCVPINPYFPPRELLERVTENIGEIVKYYPDYADVHQESLAALTGLPAWAIVSANGSTEIINILHRDLSGPIVSPIPTFGRWTDLPADFAIPMHFVQARPERNFRVGAEEILSKVREVRAQTLVLCNPNNPTGAWFSGEEMKQLLSELRDLSLIVVDESFIDFSDLESVAEQAIESENLIVVKSLGKAIGWHGIRLGYAVANKLRADVLRKHTPYWNINGLASFVLKNMADFREVYAESFEKAAAERLYMYQRLQTVDGLTTYPSKANFLYSKLPPVVSGKKIVERLLRRDGLFVRECSNKVGSSDGYLRMAVLKRDATDKLVRALETSIAEMRDAADHGAKKQELEIALTPLGRT